MQVAIIKYNAGNTFSVSNALNRLGIEPILTDNIEELQKADKIIFPGVGHAEAAMSYLKKYNLNQVIPQFQQPFLGICLGMQLLCRHSEEANTPCLGIIDLTVKRFPNLNANQKVPHMGWNQLETLQSPLFEGVLEKSYTYFVHSYYVPESELTTATTNYIHPFSAAIQKDNFYAVQFHPEKSSEVGEKILENFLKL